MAENLRSTHYSDGIIEIPGYYAPNGDDDNIGTYGYLYTWDVVMNGEPASASNPSDVHGICPNGWHVPSNSEFNSVLQNPQFESQKAGMRSESSGYSEFGQYASYWTSTEEDMEPDYRFRYTTNNEGSIADALPSSAMSVRCVRDVPPVFSITRSSGSATTTVCQGGSAAVTYTAAVTVGENIKPGYTYTWNVPSELQKTISGNACTVIYPYNASPTEYSILCTATPTTDEPLMASHEETVQPASASNTPDFEEANAGFTVKVSNLSNVSGLSWGDGSSVPDFSDPNNLTKNYTSSGVYTITATSSEGCTKAKQVAVGHATLHPCLVTTKRDNEGGYATYIDSLRDIENNWYAVTQIGSQCWMAENMRVDHFEVLNNNGDYVQGGEIGEYGGGGMITKRYDMSGVGYEKNTYGYLYQWGAAFNLDASPTANSYSNSIPSGIRGLCPHGWHLPSRAEFEVMLNHIGNDTRKLSDGFSWVSGSQSNLSYENRDSTGFRAMPVGKKAYYPTVCSVADAPGRYAFFWTSSQYSGTDGTAAYIAYNSTGMGYGNTKNNTALSVRCVRDTSSIIPPDLSISADIDNPKICNNQPVTVTFTANISDTEHEDEYTYVWFVEDNKGYEYPCTPNGKTCSVTYYHGVPYHFAIYCTATRNGISTPASTHQTPKDGCN
jgi:uncharacterized protein (TIGR02145 family)